MKKQITTYLPRLFFAFVPCLLYLWAVTGAPHADGADILPAPDAEEYTLLAFRLAHFQPPLIGIGIHDYPSRYSLAFPALLAPAAALLHFDATRLYLASAFFGLVSVFWFARVGAWILGSRAAGALTAAFFALHPQMARAGTTTMSETAILMIFFMMLDLARPWLDPKKQPETEMDKMDILDRMDGMDREGASFLKERKEGGTLRAALLGLALGWLTLAKAPFAYWALALTALVAARAIARRAYAPLAAITGAGLACALADLLYRRWAFGAWGMNGYKYWVPQFYGEFLQTFNISYLRGACSLLAPEPRGNIIYYGRILLGLSDDFYGRFMIPVTLAFTAVVLLSHCTTRKQKSQITYFKFQISNLKSSICNPQSAILLGWAVTGVLFCGFYFWQDPRFPHLWIPLVDLAAAWAITRFPSALPLRRGVPARIHAYRLAQGLALLLALFLLRGEFRRVRDVVHNDPAATRWTIAERFRLILARVPADAWLFTNFKPVSIDLLRPHPGPTGSLYASALDAAWPLMNMHMAAIDSLGLAPRLARNATARNRADIPPAWATKPAELIGWDGAWSLTPEERQAFFAHPAYALVVRPINAPDTARDIDQRVLPLLRQSLTLTPLIQAPDAVLYRLAK